MAETHQWMTYPPTGGTARFPIEAVKDWAARGWEPCEAPPEPDLTNTVLVDGVEPEPAEPEPEPAASQVLPAPEHDNPTDATPEGE